MRTLLLLLLFLIGGFFIFFSFSSPKPTRKITILSAEKKGLASPRGTGKVWQDSVKADEGQKGRVIRFHAYTPAPRPEEQFPVIIFVGGLNSSGAEATGGVWAAFADRHRFAIVAPWFLFDPEEWSERRSYQYPSAWSGEAMDSILDRAAQHAPLDLDHLYLFGMSAGAQFVQRYALLRPERCRAVAAHAAGGYTWPTASVPTTFLITVGSKDADRSAQAQAFADAARRLGISVELKVIEGLGHTLSTEQIHHSWNFFVKVKSNEM